MWNVILINKNIFLIWNKLYFFNLLVNYNRKYFKYIYNFKELKDFSLNELQYRISAKTPQTLKIHLFDWLSEDYERLNHSLKSSADIPINVFPFNPFIQRDLNANQLLLTSYHVRCLIK